MCFTFSFPRLTLTAQSPLYDLRLVDYDAAKEPVGVEFMGARDGLDVSDVPFSGQIAAILARNGLDFAIFA